IGVHLKTSPYGGTTAVVLLPTALLDGATAETPPGAAHETARPEEHLHARVSDGVGRQEPVPAPVDRPALTAAVPAAGRTTTTARPPGGPTLRLHRSDASDAAGASAERDGSHPPQPTAGESGDLPRRVRQASLAPQLRGESPVSPVRPARARDDEERTPEAVRDRMAAYRDGWSRGGGRRPGRTAPPQPPSGDSTEGDPA
ncbi:ATPase, partial [Streptomyces sp. NPDC059409]